MQRCAAPTLSAGKPSLTSSSKEPVQTARASPLGDVGSWRGISKTCERGLRVRCRNPQGCLTSRTGQSRPDSQSKPMTTIQARRLICDPCGLASRYRPINHAPAATALVKSHIRNQYGSGCVGEI